MFKIMYKEDSNAQVAVAYRRKVALYQASSIMDNKYYEHKRTGPRQLRVDLLPVKALSQFLLGHTDVISNIESKFFPGYVIVGITSRYAGTGTDFMYIVLE